MDAPSPPAGRGYGPNVTGYVTEKLRQALLAGAVPLYWGDSPVEPGVLNEGRILHWDGDGAAALATLRQLHENATAREAWFAQPVLEPGAQGWLEAWCGEAGDLLVAELRRACGC